MSADMQWHLRSIRSVSVLQVMRCPYHPLETFVVPLISSRCLLGHRERTFKGPCREVLQNTMWFPHVEERWCTCWNSWVYWDFSWGPWYWKVNFYCLELLENVLLTFVFPRHSCATKRQISLCTVSSVLPCTPRSDQLRLHYSCRLHSVGTCTKHYYLATKAHYLWPDHEAGLSTSAGTKFILQ